ncbi:MAG: aromatic aminobenezylarsenical efflux permease ArsG family transporter [Bacteroidota bacterium]|jgi:cytochrome c biogenesis protein CcdA|nr:aromatic aminobenezylarsenical efflux permease ArsG family transporter [Bacteroidota bacterium]
MEFLQQLLDSTDVPVLTALILGLMTAISPCPLATNITAIGYISRELENRRAVFINGMLYTLGRVISYTALGVAIFLGAETFDVSRLFQGWGEKLLGPLLVLIGVFMLDFIPLRFGILDRLTSSAGEKSGRGAWGALLLGMIFALAFCPYSGVLYFVMLIPMSVASADGLYLPAVFAVATGLPVIIAAWLIAFTVSGVGTFYKRLRSFERWFRRVVGVLFILTGIYLIMVLYFS